jgi:hypothetical protein
MSGKGNAKTAKSDVSIEHDFTYATSGKGLNLKRRKSVKTVNMAEHSFPRISASSPSLSSGLLLHV